MNILDPRFRYTPAVATDVRKTFERAREEMAKANARQGVRPKPATNVAPITKGRKA